MTAMARLRSQYAQESITTASSAQLVTMVYDRLSQDLSVAELGLGRRNVEQAHNALLHAQAIVRELSVSLDVTVWKPASELRRLYDYVTEELIAANVSKDVTRVHNARQVIEPLRDAWHQAAKSLGS